MLATGFAVLGGEFPVSFNATLLATFQQGGSGWVSEQTAQDVLAAYSAAVRAVNGRAAVERALHERAGFSPTVCVAVGKAAVDMAQGAIAALGDALTAGLVVCKEDCPPRPFPSGWTCMAAGHPLPDERSLNAGQALLMLLKQSRPDAKLLFLISGGASSLVEVPAPSLDLAKLRKLNEWLIGSGWSIRQINAVRRRASLIKGGKLRDYLGQRNASVLAISDVQGDDPAIIGSGLLTQPQPIELPGPLPAEFEACLLADAADVADSNEPPAVSFEIIANNSRARSAAAAELESRGYEVTVHDDECYGDAVQTGYDLAQRLVDGPRGIHIWGGETTVVLPEKPGRGGRCQSLALAAACVLAGRPNVGLLAAGTDGTDGPGEDAGALVDGSTIDRGRAEGFDANDALDRADAGSFLAAAGALINTGPTGTNVMDLMIGWRQ